MTQSSSVLQSDTTAPAWKAALGDSLVWDNHSCMPLRPHDLSYMSQLGRLRKSGVDMVLLNIGYGETPWQDHIKMLSAFRAWLEDHSAEFQIVDTVDDIFAAKKTGRLAVGFNIEGGAGVDNQVDLVRLYYALGVRWMLIAYNKSNRLGGGCHDNDEGLTEFGRRVLDEMASVGMIVCCTHTGWRTARDVFEYSNNPVIFSHSNAYSVHAHPRNIPDSLIKDCAASGGVVGVNGVSFFLGPGDPVDRIFAHIDHIVELVGPNYVGLGLDYVFDRTEIDEALAGMRATFPEVKGYYEGAIDFVAPESIGAIVMRMQRAGYGSESIRAVLGGNFMRLAKEVWK